MITAPTFYATPAPPCRPSWLVLSWYHHPEPHQQSLKKVCNRPGSIDRTAGTPGSGKNLYDHFFYIFAELHYLANGHTETEIVS